MSIPKQIHAIWLGSPVPDHYAREMARLVELNPGWEIVWWHEEQLEKEYLSNQAIFDQAHRLVPADSVYQLQSDIARYELLDRYGGVYVDLDYRWQQPLSNLFDPDEDWLVTCWERQDRHVANGFIASPPAHLLIARAVRETRVWCGKWGGRGLRANRLTGPGGMWTDLVHRERKRGTSRSTVRVLDQQLLHPVPWSHPEWADDFDFPDAVAVHLFGHQRELKGIS